MRPYRGTQASWAWELFGDDAGAWLVTFTSGHPCAVLPHDRTESETVSPQAIASPEDLDRFAQDLTRFCSELESAMSGLQNGFIRLGDTWRDQEHQRYAQEFEQTMRVLHHFLESSGLQIPFLQRKAQRLRDYLGQR